MGPDRVPEGAAATGEPARLSISHVNRRIKETMQRAIGALALVIMTCSPAVAASLTYTDARSHYVARCAPELSSQGMTTEKAKEVCSCVFSGLAAEVRMSTPGDAERFQSIMAAQPNPNGSASERQLYRVMSDCFGR
jgi:hypothetical protein